MMSATTDLNLLNALIQSLHAQRLDVQAARMIVEVSVVHGAYNRVSTTLTHPRFSNMFRFSRPRIFSCVWSRALMVAFSEARDTAAHRCTRSINLYEAVAGSAVAASPSGPHHLEASTLEENYVDEGYRERPRKERPVTIASIDLDYRI